jgi:hypothetical protein
LNNLQSILALELTLIPQLVGEHIGQPVELVSKLRQLYVIQLTVAPNDLPAAFQTEHEKRLVAFQMLRLGRLSGSHCRRGND